MMKGITQGLNYPQGLALLRMGFGGYFLSEGFDKISKGWLAGADQLLPRLQGTLNRGGGEGFYRPFLEGVVVPNVETFSTLVALGEFAVGLTLVLGLFTRAAALLGIWLNLNYMLMKGVMASQATNDHLFLLAEAIFLVTAAGRVWGLDASLQNRLAPIPVARWLAGATDSASGGASPPIGLRSSN